MYRVKDLKFLEVFNDKGRKYGEIEDIAIDYYKGKVIGFKINKSIFSKKDFVAIEDVITIGDSVIAKNIRVHKTLDFNAIKGLDIIEESSNRMIGVVEELLIDEKFEIKALITSKGFFDKFINGKSLLLLKETILGDENILYRSNNKIDFKSMPHNIWR
ncbi:PRC-barrel domain-containing protein [uncultured Clostridium sp.]|uniref:PRC-barrel domain-containing protein n=1 Tax=uncultured Clostridium sp. TaxID=59620 RepID=UPI002622DA83|nr:PRC-barrel domain-containing protein [uncultured Clostridium sp.]